VAIEPANIREHLDSFAWDMIIHLREELDLLDSKFFSSQFSREKWDWMLGATMVEVRQMDLTTRIPLALTNNYVEASGHGLWSPGRCATYSDPGTLAGRRGLTSNTRRTASTPIPLAESETNPACSSRACFGLVTTYLLRVPSAPIQTFWLPCPIRRSRFLFSRRSRLALFSAIFGALFVPLGSMQRKRHDQFFGYRLLSHLQHFCASLVLPLLHP
jgi:hypothetical protein